MIKQLQWNIPVNRLLLRRKKCTETKALVKGRPALMPTEWSHYRICKCMVEQWHWTNAQITPFNHKYFNINCQTLFRYVKVMGRLRGIDPPFSRHWEKNIDFRPPFFKVPGKNIDFGFLRKKVNFRPLFFAQTSTLDPLFRCPRL